jgi:ornithine cyclodeaminase/alanine dehydrogenase-like protein (mu-crystallin family)
MKLSDLPNVLIVTRRDIAGAMTTGDHLDAAERAFRAGATGAGSSPAPMHLPASRGGFHAKGASISMGSDYVAVKVNGNFPGNPTELGLPTIQGAILLADGSNGCVLAILDSIEVTLRRTAAATALAARLLARPDSRTLLLCGCGEQGRAHITSLRDVLPVQRLLLWDRDESACRVLAAELGGTPADDLAAAARSADAITCCTSAREPFLGLEMVKPGTFIAAVGADNPDKSEIAPRLMAAATVVVDSLGQCAEMGDLRHAIAAGVMAESDVHAELGQILVGAKPGRRSRDEIIIFDSTGTGLLDVAASAAIYERLASDPSVQSVALA